MRHKTLFSISPYALLGGVLAGSFASAQAPVQSHRQVTVTTHRSDGSVFPSVSQTKRTQKRREVRISGSQQALPNRTAPAAHEENVAGGNFVTATAGTSELADIQPMSVTIYPVLVVSESPILKPKR